MVLFAKETWLMMIAFITFNSSLIPFIEGLYSSNPVGFEFLVLCFHLLLFLFYQDRVSFAKDLGL